MVAGVGNCVVNGVFPDIQPFKVEGGVFAGVLGGFFAYFLGFERCEFLLFELPEDLIEDILVSVDLDSSMVMYFNGNGSGSGRWQLVAVIGEDIYSIQEDCLVTKLNQMVVNCTQ